MKVLLTGATGQLGSALISSVPKDWLLDACTRSELDITDENTVRHLIGTRAPDVVINAAAYTAVDRAEADEKTAMLTNGDAVRHLAAATNEVGAKLIQVSTDFVFDGRSSRPYRPGDVCNPLSAYGRSKRKGELEALPFDRNLVVRTAWVYGAQGSNFVRTMLRLMKERDAVGVVADQFGTPTHAASLARSIWALASRDAVGIMHVTDAGVASWYDFAVAIQEEALTIGLLDSAVPVLPISTDEYLTPARRPPFSVLDNTETWALLGARAAHWRTELRCMLHEFKGMMLG